MTPEQLHNKRVLVVGLGVTGASVVRYLHKHAVRFDVADEHAGPGEALLAYMDGANFHSNISGSLCCEYDVLVLSPGIPRALPAISQAIDAGIPVIGDIELFACAVQQPVIAVTGSNGKSTVVSWLAHVLQSAGRQAVLCGNIGMPALDSLADDAHVYVLELSSYQLESTRSLQPLSAVVLNISDDHMDRYSSLAAYAAVKRTVYSDCKHRVVNRNDAMTWLNQEELAASTCKSVAYFALSSAQAGDYQLQGAANDAWLCSPHEQIVNAGELQTPGNHNIANALAVMALLEPLKVDNASLAKGLTSFRGLQHRTELVGNINGVRWFNDSKGTNIDACKKAIEAMPGAVVLLAGGLGKDADFSSLYELVEQRVKALVLIGRDRQVIADALEHAAPVTFADSMSEAVHTCSRLADAGDVVLLSPACSSFDMFRNFEERGECFTRAVEEMAA